MSECALKTDNTLSQAYIQEIKKLDSKLLNLGLSKPALRALVDHSIFSLAQLSTYKRTDIISWHGIGPKALTKLSPFLGK